MARRIIISGAMVMGVLAPVIGAADEHDLSTLMGKHVLQVLEDRGSLSSTPSFARDTVIICAQHRQAVSEMANRFQDTEQAQSLLAMAQQAPAAAQEVRTRIATTLVDRLISQGQDALPAIVQDLEAEVLFTCYEGALLAAQDGQQAGPTPPSPEAETAPLLAEPAPPLVELPALPPSLAAVPNSRPVSRPASRVAEAARPPEPEPETLAEAPALPPPPPEAETAPAVVDPALEPEPLLPVTELPALPPSLAADPSSRPVSRPAARVAEAVALPEPEPLVEPPALPPPLLETETVLDMPEATNQPEPLSPVTELPAEAISGPELLPWGVILTAQSSRETAERQATRIAGLLAEERIDYVQMRVPGQSALRHVAQVGRTTRSEAEELCGQLKARGAACMVLRN